MQAVAQEGYQFAYWEVDLIFEMKDDTLVDMGDGYTYINENGYEIYAFSNPFESSLYSPTDSQLMINRVMPKEMEDISILHYSVKAYFVNEAEMDWIAVPRIVESIERNVAQGIQLQQIAVRSQEAHGHIFHNQGSLAVLDNQQRAIVRGCFLMSKGTFLKSESLIPS